MGGRGNIGERSVLSQHSDKPTDPTFVSKCLVKESRRCSILSGTFKGEPRLPTPASVLRPKFHRIPTGALILAVLSMAVLIAVPATLFGQAYFGTVSGELTDASGAVVQGAKVVLTDQQKGYTFSTTSDTRGRYLFRSVAPGVYRASAEAKGFEKTASANFKVDINENATADLSLKVSGTTQSIEVSAQAQAIQTGDAETGR